MITNKFGEQIYTEDDVFNYIMSESIDIEKVSELPLTDTSPDIPIEQFDLKNQIQWFMPDEYKEMDIAKHILGLCKTDAELQRVGEELLLYMEHNLFDLLKYLKYLVDTMEANNVIWGVGRGSSVASYVLYLLKVHRVDSMYYDLDVKEFLR